MLTILFVETSLELVPHSIIRHPSVTRNAKREGKRPDEVLLDRSLHHHAMLTLPESEKRGRPDILQFCLLEALGSPLNKQGGLSLYAHTLNKIALSFSQELRLPRDCYRFKSLMEQLLVSGQVPPSPGKSLVVAEEKLLHQIKEELQPSRTIALTSKGKLEQLPALCRRLSEEKKPLVLIGAYPNGAMRPETLAEADERVSIYPETLEAWTIVSRLIYEYEKTIGIV
jgi:rRNA small subunit pseudouridine methyltransferase Nep1